MELNIGTVAGVLSDNPEADDRLLRDEVSEGLRGRTAPAVASRRDSLQPTPDCLRGQAGSF